MTTKKQSYTPSVVFHPGETLGEKLNEMGMSIKEFAVRASMPEQDIIAFVSGKSAVTTDEAAAFERVTNIPAAFWMRKQRLYNEHLAREKRAALKSKIVNPPLLPTVSISPDFFRQQADPVGKV